MSFSLDNTLSLDAFVPSKKRCVFRNAIAGSTGNQLSGSALPSLILGEWSSPSEHVRAAKTVNPFADLINATLSQQDKAIAYRCARKPEETIQNRPNAVAILAATAYRLGPARSRWIATLPDKSPAAEIHFPLIHLLAVTLEYPDTMLVRDLSNGMPIAGPIPSTPGLTSRKEFAELTYQKWKEGIQKRNANAIERALKAQGSEIPNKRWEKTLTEIENGWITPPTDLDETLARTVPLTPRYAIQEQHGNQHAKIRLIDDFRASAINAIVEMGDTDIPESLDTFIALATYFKLIAPGCELQGATLDFAHAYKHVPIQEDQKEFATILLAPPSGPLKVATLRTQPFGSKRQFFTPKWTGVPKIFCVAGFFPLTFYFQLEQNKIVILA